MKVGVCISQTAKYIILCFNGLIGVCAIALIVFGIIYMLFYEQYGFYVFSVVPLGPVVIGVGVLCLFIAAFGCCGALHQNTCLLTTYALILIVLLAIHLALGLLVVLKYFDENDFAKMITDMIQSLYDGVDADSIKKFYDIQIQFSCCGVKGKQDYDVSVDSYPSSCCKDQLSPCWDPFDVGCAAAFADATKLYMVLIGWVSIGFAGAELIGAIFALLVRRQNLKNDFKFKGRPAEESSI